MNSNLTNLLPEDRVRSLRRLYASRLAVVSLFLLAGVIVIHGVLLLPTYVHLMSTVHDRTIILTALTENLGGSEEQEIQARVDVLSEDARYLARLAEIPKASAAIAAVVELPRQGITLTGFSFSPTASGGAVMSSTGRADTRESLRAYENSLKAVPFVESVELPISAYAKERDIDFTVTLVGPFLP